MNTWFSAGQPLMGEIFKYLPTRDVCQWRRTVKNTELTDAFSNQRWDEFVTNTAPVDTCGTCFVPDYVVGKDSFIVANVT